MRTFIADEPFEPVEKQLPAPPPGSVLTHRQQKLALLLIGAIFVGIGIWVALFIDDPARLSYGLAFCAVGALAFYASRIPWSRGGRPGTTSAASGRVFLGGASLVFDCLAYQSFEKNGVLGAFWIESAALACSALFIYVLAGAYQDRKIATLMRKSASAASANAAIQPKPRTPGLALQAPAIRLDIYLQGELPALPGRYLTPVGTDDNIIGLPPRRILYLYNFFSVDALVHKVKGNWRRFGPVYFLGSPGDFSYGHAFDPRIGTSVETAILATPESFDARLKSAADTVLPPGDASLKGVSHFSGGYPHHLFLCNDGSWRHAVDELLGYVDLVMLDACGYDAQRAGLNWEIGQLLDRIALRNLVVLIDVDTDQAALCAAFRAAWHSMDNTSPNNTTNPGPVRWVLLEPTDERAKSEALPSLPTEADPLGLYPKCSLVVRALMMSNYRDALLDDRIFGMFAESTR
jgi:hypothetical protein